MSDKQQVIAGIHYGEHGLDPKTVIEEIHKYGSKCSLIMLRPGVSRNTTGEVPTAEDYYRWARYFKDNKQYFCFLYTQLMASPGKDSLLTKEIVENIYEIAGEYFLGDSLGEVGNCIVMMESHRKKFCPEGEFADMEEAKNGFVNAVKSQVQKNRELGIKTVSNIESHTMMKYSLEAGLDICYAEVFLGNVDQILSFVRGATRGYEKKAFGAYIAHEWYAGMHHEDPLKMKRLALAYRAAYMAGASEIFLESGFEEIGSYGADFNDEHPLCQAVRLEVDRFNRFICEDNRPVHGPMAKVAFISGYLDSYAGDSKAYGGVRPAVWGQHDKEEWGYGSAEHSFRILKEVYRSADWFSPLNYGDADYSSAPAYGQYDVLPIEAPVSVMKNYDWLIFTGWNTMTEENYEKLKEYVRDGGKILISAAHLKVGKKRWEDSPYIHGGKLSDFLGCDFTDERIRTNYGYKFARESSIDGIIYPGTDTYICDPTGSSCYTDYVKVEKTTGRSAAVLSREFFSRDFDAYPPAVIEQAYGEGNVLFMCTEEYPGAPGVYTLYEILVKQILTSTHQSCEIKVLASDKVRFAVYRDEDKYKVYLLNTDMNVEQKAKVCYHEITAEKMISPLELDFVEFQI